MLLYLKIQIKIFKTGVINMGLNLKENAAKAGRKITGRQSRIGDNIRVLEIIYNTFIKELDTHSVEKDFGGIMSLRVRYGKAIGILENIVDGLENTLKSEKVMKAKYSLGKWWEAFKGILTKEETYYSYRRDKSGAEIVFYYKVCENFQNGIVNYFSFKNVNSLKFFSSLDSKEFKTKLTTTSCSTATKKLEEWLTKIFFVGELKDEEKKWN